MITTHKKHKRTHIVMSEQLIHQIDACVGRRQRSRFLCEAATRELSRLQLTQALEQSVGAWKSKDHPELRDGAAAYIHKLRRHDDRLR